MIQWVCLCLLLLQVNALPHAWQQYRAPVPVADMPSRFPATQVQAQEPVYPPLPLADSLLSVSENMGAGAGVGMGVEQVPLFDPMLPGYVPTSTPFDNPSSSLANPVSTIPNVPDCSVRPQTVVEIQRMRQSASDIAVMMQHETGIMTKRKTYVEQMTSYLNDRIRELNRVKSELAQETKWLDLSSNRIQELEEKEKLIKLQDIQSCLNDQTSRNTADVSAVGKSLTDIQRQSATVQASINAIKARMDAINAGASGGSSGGF